MKFLYKISVVFFAFLTFSCGSFGEIVNRKAVEKKNYSYVYEIANCGISALKYMTNRGTITVDATVTQKVTVNRDSVGNVISEKKELITDTGSITIERNKKNRETTVNGNIYIGNLEYSNMGDTFTKKKFPIPYYQKSNLSIYDRYNYYGEELCQALAEYKLIQRMNTIGGQALFMPNYSWGYKYDDSYFMVSDKKDTTHEEIAVDVKTTLIHLTITATAIDFFGENGLGKKIDEKQVEKEQNVENQFLQE